ncbi:putative ribonuclease H-like domain-containing protein [Tanacetum coccineum]
MYCLVVTDDFSRFSWVFFLATKDENSGILKAFITGIENQINHRVKIIRCDNETEFKNKKMNQFCEMKGIKREFSVARTPQQNRVAERKNKTLIEAARIMLADSKLPTNFWAEAVNTACYVQNRLRSSRSGPTWLFDIDTLTKSMNYKPVIAGNQSNGNAGTKENIGAGQIRKKTVPDQEYILLPLWTSDPSPSKGPKNTKDYAGKKATKVPETESGVSSKEDDKDDQDLRNEFKSLNGENDVNSTNNINIVSSTVNTAIIKDNVVDENIVYGCADDPNMPNLEEIVYTDDDEDVGAEAGMTNLDIHIPVSFIPTTRIHKDHSVEQIIGDIHSAPQTRRMTKRVMDTTYMDKNIAK